jgi:hypothetical protein
VLQRRLCENETISCVRGEKRLRRTQNPSLLLTINKFYQVAAN